MNSGLDGTITKQYFRLKVIGLTLTDISSIVCEVNATVFFFYKYYKCLKCKIKTPQLTFIKTNQPKIHK